MSTLIDTNVIVDLLEGESAWRYWSAGQLREARRTGDLVINQIVYAEVSAALPSPEAVEAALPRHIYRRDSLPWQAAWPAAQAFLSYRRRGGARPSPLPDFLIGAHAASAGHRLLTRDPRRYRAYFPELTIIAPDGDP